MGQSAAHNRCAYIYILGEMQSTLLAAEEEIFTFAKAHMAAIGTAELEAVLSSVFGMGEFFPGPDTALGALVHEYASRTCTQGLEVPIETAARPGHYCQLIFVFQAIEGGIKVRTAARIYLDLEKNPLHSEEEAHQLVLEQLPTFQHIFLEDACAPQSRLIALLKAAALYHINRKLA
ncbi:MAG: hypothetical protein GX087_03800 [Desulfobulbaceae bacterium]|nr:hypothetical protein [Desulfobulbaceae bacterium]